MSTELADRMAARLRERLQPSALEVLDESWQHEGHAGANGTGFGTHFRVRIASPLFDGKSRVVRHQLVYQALQDFIERDGVHALAIGATAGLIIGMITRTARGHTGRVLQVSRAETTAYVLVMLTAAVRVLLPLALPTWLPMALVLSAAGWSVAFAIYLFIYTPWLLKTRFDGKDG